MNLNEFNNSRRFELYVHKRISGEVFQLMGDEINIIKELVIDEQLENPLVEATIKLRYSPATQNLVENGDILTYYENELTLDYAIEYKRKHVFFVMDISDDDDLSNQTIIAHNAGHWVMRNSYHLQLNAKETTSQFIRRIASENNIVIDRIESTSYQHEARIFPNVSLFESWYAVLTTNILKERILHTIRFSDIGLVFEKISEDSKVWLFEATGKYSNILSPRRNISIIDSDFTNVAIAIRQDQQSQSEALRALGINNADVVRHPNEESVMRYGEFPTTIDVSSYGKPDEVIDRLEEIVRNGTPVDSISFRTYAINSIKPTDRIIVYYPNTGSLGIYFIETISTSIQEKEFWHDIHAIKRQDIQRELINQLAVSVSESSSILSPIS